MNPSVQTLAAVFLCLFSAISILDGAPPDSAPSLPSREKTLILEAYNLWTALADEIWPGAAILKSPMIYVGEQHEYAIGFERPLEGFSDTGTSLLGKSVQVRSRTLALNLSASFPMQGIPAVLMGSVVSVRDNCNDFLIVLALVLDQIDSQADRVAHGGTASRVKVR